ncbi:MAG: hypothetical protein U9Q30_09485, partial [Campylobacterota bacterium]|nr:hypothetical protein [Campylobacterota bacterium]
LGLYKKKDDETFLDVLEVMENTRVFTKKSGKKYLKNLKELGYIGEEDNLTMIGVEKAKEVEREFTLV